MTSGLESLGEPCPYQSLAVPIGLRGKDDLVYLNLHEKAHGPHGFDRRDNRFW